MDNEYVRSTSSGDHSFIIVTKSNRIFVTGYNPSNELAAASSGNICNLTEVHLPVKEPIVQTASKYYANAFLFESGRIISTSSCISVDIVEQVQNLNRQNKIVGIGASPTKVVFVTADNSGYESYDSNHLKQVVQSHSPSLHLRCSVGYGIDAWYLYQDGDNVAIAFPRLHFHIHSIHTLCDISIVNQH
jgi:hypothetical protein